MTEADAVCPSCGAPVLATEKYCEECGRPLTGAGTGVASGGASANGGRGATAPARSGASTSQPTQPAGPTKPCVGCGARPEAIGADRYCQQCGLLQPDPRDHEEVDLGIAAGVSDRGLRHHRNEDAMLLQTLGAGTVVAVVCDGVSSSVKPEMASRVAADTAGVALMQAVTARPEQLSAAVVDAVAAAQAAVVSIPWTPDGALAAPSCTFVSATVHEGTITVGWVGDSRAYWVGPTDAERLTADDSWAGEAVAAGLMTEPQAEADNRSHAITRWLGEDAPEQDPQVTTLTPGAPGRLVVCSDGLWNYLSAPEQLIEVIGPSPASPLAAARALTDFALTAGGHDNVTTVVIEVTPPESKGEA